MGKTLNDLGYCGAVCQECNIFRALMFGEELRPETIQRWRADAKKYWQIDSLEPGNLNCRGCRYTGDDVFFVFKLCPVKKCCREKELVSCGLCPDFDKCQWLEAEGRKNIESIIASGK